MSRVGRYPCNQRSLRPLYACLACLGCGDRSATVRAGSEASGADLNTWRCVRYNDDDMGQRAIMDNARWRTVIRHSHPLIEGSPE